MKKAIISALLALIGAIAGGLIVGKRFNSKWKRTVESSRKNKELFILMNQWVGVKQEGKNIADYLIKNKYFKVAIYGMSYVGDTLYNELKNGEIEVAYGIDRNVSCIYSDIKVVSPDDVLEDVDAVIVTAITYFDEIEEKLSLKMGCPILCLSDILYEM